jgi:hypothetical protein
MRATFASVCIFVFSWRNEEVFFYEQINLTNITWQVTSALLALLYFKQDKRYNSFDAYNNEL